VERKQRVLRDAWSRRTINRMLITCAGAFDALARPSSSYRTFTSEGLFGSP